MAGLTNHYPGSLATPARPGIIDAIDARADLDEPQGRFPAPTLLSSGNAVSPAAYRPP